ncbi:MAG: RNase adapter RapZ [Dongiaceae bacterium]
MSEPPAKAKTNEGRILLITGMCGAGRSSTLRLLEDTGYETIDNLPLYLLPDLLRPIQLFRRPIAIGIDIRTRDFNADSLVQITQQLRQSNAPVSLIFLDCADEVLQARFTETRRRHPLAEDRPLADGIRHERVAMEPAKVYSDLVIDTTQLSLPDLRRIVQGYFAFAAAPGMRLSVMSFAYKHGTPREADMIFDLRFLRNPHYDANLRPLTGKDAKVGEFIEQDPDFGRFFDDATRLLTPLIPRYQQEGKSYLTIAFGCTGGRHRSVYAATKLAQWLQQNYKRVTLFHRDIDRQPVHQIEENAA